jgi:hypothetical protein
MKYIIDLERINELSTPHGDNPDAYVPTSVHSTSKMLDLGFNDFQEPKRVKINDDIKSNFCSANSIKLIRIDYTQFDEIENIINENLQIQNS